LGQIGRPLDIRVGNGQQFGRIYFKCQMAGQRRPHPAGANQSNAYSQRKCLNQQLPNQFVPNC
jgi:hypothetical protein